MPTVIPRLPLGSAEKGKLMIITIFRLEDYASYLNGDEEALARFQYLADLSEDQFNFLAELIDSTDDYDWR